MFSHDDARSRILAAARERVSVVGSAGASVRGIAADADVSPALVLHHFGSKDGLIAACDAHVLAAISDLKSDALAAGPGLDLLGAVAHSSEVAAPLVRYLARRLVEGGPAVDELIDTMVADAHRYVRAGVESGLLRPSANEQDRTVLLTMWSLAALVLHRHVERLLGYSILDGPEGVKRWSELGAEVLMSGLLTPEATGAARTQEATT